MSTPEPLTPGQWLDELLAIPARLKRIEIMAEKTTAALAELSSAIDEVSGELDSVEAKLQEALAHPSEDGTAALDTETAEKVLALAGRLRSLRTDAVPAVQDAIVEDDAAAVDPAAPADVSSGEGVDPAVNSNP